MIGLLSDERKIINCYKAYSVTQTARRHKDRFFIHLSALDMPRSNYDL